MRNRKTCIMLVVLCLVSLSIVSLPGVSARFTTGSATGDEARIAAFNVTYDNIGNSTFSDTFTITLEPNKSQTYEFEMNNSSEVSVQMTATLDLEGNLPVTVSCEKKNSGSATNSPLTGGKDTATTGRYIWTDNLDNTTQTYIITVSWEEEKNSYIYANGVEIANLTVEASQID